jgi:hypothetical protein
MIDIVQSRNDALWQAFLHRGEVIRPVFPAIAVETVECGNIVGTVVPLDGIGRALVTVGAIVCKNLRRRKEFEPANAYQEVAQAASVCTANYLDH